MGIIHTSKSFTETDITPELDLKQVKCCLICADLTIPVDTNIKQTNFIVAMETNLATAYSVGKARRDERAASVQALLEKLNPDNDPLLNWRKKRAVTINGNTAQVHERTKSSLG